VVVWSGRGTGGPILARDRVPADSSPRPRSSDRRGERGMPRRRLRRSCGSPTSDSATSGVAAAGMPDSGGGRSGRHGRRRRSTDRAGTVPVSTVARGHPLLRAAGRSVPSDHPLRGHLPARAGRRLRRRRRAGHHANPSLRPEPRGRRSSRGLHRGRPALERDRRRAIRRRARASRPNRTIRRVARFGANAISLWLRTFDCGFSTSRFASSRPAAPRRSGRPASRRFATRTATWCESNSAAAARVPAASPR
jgi:hypothetical protein